MKLAHISTDGRMQSVKDHNQAVAEMARAFAEPFGYGDIAYQAGLVHDLGKTSDAFQNRILNNGPKCDHSSAGALELQKVNNLPGSISVLGHHTGLPDLGSKGDAISEPTWFGRLRKAYLGQIPEYSDISGLQPQAGIKPGFSSGFLIRMLYSCLVDADFLDTEAFMQVYSRAHKYEDIPDLLSAFYEYIEKWSEPKTELDKIRSEILQNCLSKGSLKPGLYSLTVPTGGGKTTASLGFALEHAKQHGMSRVIYITPYTSIIEQNAQVLRDAVHPENVLEHHAGYDRNGDSDEFKLEQLAAENWDSPVVITTAVRFFEALYASKPSRCRRLHNITNSVLIFDEAQLLPLEHLIPCTRAIEELVRNYHCTAVLCTATCPALDKLFKNMPIVELQTDKNRLYKLFRRNIIKLLPEVLTDTDIAGMMAKHNQILCIVNTRKAAQAVYNELPPEGRYHLSTLMHPAHRRKVLAEIKTRLKLGKTVRLVSTSLIEAGVDISFPVAMRERTGSDSISQTAGRCSRNGEWPIEDSIVYVFTRDGPVPSSLNRSIGAFNKVLSERTDIDSLEAIEDYFNALYTFTGTDNMDIDCAVRRFENNDPCPWPFRTVGSEFHFIHSGGVTVYIPTEESKPLIEYVKLGLGTREIFRKLGRYSVDIYQSDFDRLVASGDITVVGDNFAVLETPEIYSEATGLTL